jgi:hypothetical protein
MAEDPGKLMLDGHAFGALASQDVVLTRKILPGQPMQPQDQAMLRETLRTVLLAYMAQRDMLVDRGYTDVLVMGQYALLGAAVMAAASVGASWRIISHPAHFNNDRRRLTISHVNSRDAWFHYLEAWPKWRQIPLTQSEVIEIANDIFLRFGGTGSHTYSPAKTSTDVIAKLGLRRDRKLIVAFTSSPDERMASESSNEAWSSAGTPLYQASQPRSFPDQLTWLKFLIGWIRERDDLQLVIRIHPREDANKRDGVTSNHLLMLRQELVDLPKNVLVIWPRDDVSSYDLIEVAHLAQSAWSTIGLEAARLGVPTMTSDGFHSFPVGDFVLGPATPEEFGRTIDALLVEAPNLDRVILALRYYALSRLHGSVNIADTNPEAHSVPLRPFTPPVNADMVERLVKDRVWTDDIHLERRAETTPEMLAAERAATLYVLRVLLRYLFTGQVAGQDFHLSVREVTSERLHAAAPLPAEGEAILEFAGDDCRFISADDAIARYSPMAVRLAILCSRNG